MTSLFNIQAVFIAPEEILLITQNFIRTEKDKMKRMLKRTSMQFLPGWLSKVKQLEVNQRSVFNHIEVNRSILHSCTLGHYGGALRFRLIYIFSHYISI